MEAEKSGIARAKSFFPLEINAMPTKNSSSWLKSINSLLKLLKTIRTCTTCGIIRDVMAADVGIEPDVLRENGGAGIGTGGLFFPTG